MGKGKLDKALDIAGETTQSLWINDVDKYLEKANKEIFEKFSERKDSFGLHGELAEHWHAKTFNISAKVQGKPFKAEVLERNTKNSVDLVIKDNNTGKTLSRYQSKFGKDPQTTSKYLEEGDYRGQRPLVPSDQCDEVNKIRTSKGLSPATDKLEQDGVESKPLSREDAEKLKEKVKQRNEIFSWENMTYKEAFQRVGKDSVKVFGFALLIKGAWRIGKGILSDKTTLSDELRKFIKEDIKGAAIPAVKTAITGALIVAARKGSIKILKGTPAGKIAAFVEVGFRSLNHIKKYINGEISGQQLVKNVVKDGLKVAGGFIGAAKGATIGATIGSAIPVVGTLIGAVVGGMVGAIIGETVVEKSIEIVEEIVVTVQQKEQLILKQI